jgi:N-acetylglucosaminyldiphosphoundecaprenol N-acetyl-beta-D-mannosaminyltransferase
MDRNTSEANIFGYWISRRGKRGDITRTRQLIASGGKGSYMACANPHSLVVASGDPVFNAALKNADILLPDGTGVVMASKIFNVPVMEKVAGYDFFLALSASAEQSRGLRYFFLGSSEHVLDRIVSRLNLEYPSIAVCGIYSPPYKESFSETDNITMVEAINAANPDVLWVGMTAPKQEKWIYANRERLNVPFIGAIGAVFDFYAGTKVRSSVFWQKLGLEWLPRFMKEPKRLWERNIKSTPIFISWVVKEKVRQLCKL